MKNRIVVKMFGRSLLQTWLTITALVLAVSLGTALAQESGFDHRADLVARLLAGIKPPSGDPVIDRLVALPAWGEHSQWMTKQWKQVRARLSAMESWRDRELTIRDAQGKTLLYPFSGPDFFNAYTFFPTHRRYIFFSLERPGILPELKSRRTAEFERLLKDLHAALHEIFERNYFITDYMTKQLTTPQIKGVLPVIVTSMALMDLQVQKIEPVDLFPELTSRYKKEKENRPRLQMRGLRIDFMNPKGSQSQELYYFSLDVTDKALKYYPDFMDWVGRDRPATAFIKSASYLLHDNQFARTRRMLLDSADLVVQDDSGIPYRFLIKPPWQVKLYGRYTKPIKSLSWGYQRDLEEAYKSYPDNPALPFPFGYAWRDGKSGLLVATRSGN